MNKFLSPLILLGVASNLLANAGPGPWANGAYYPGQLDGRYSANVYNDAQPNGGIVSSNTFTFTTNAVTGAVTTNITTPAGANVVSGILGFAVRNGTPAVSAATNSSAAGGSTNGSATQQSMGLDASMNYFLIYVNGDSFAGSTAANINISTGKVAGTLLNGGGRVNFLLFTNQEIAVGPPPVVANTGVEVISLPTASANGYFNAKIKSNKSPFTFKGNGELSTRDASGTAASERVYSFKLDGIKATDNSISAYSLTGRNAP